MNLFNKITSNRVAGVFAGLIFCVSIAVIVTNPPVVQLAHAQTAVGLSGATPVFQVQNADPCNSPAVAKSSFLINITTATTTEIANAAGTGKKVYFCGAQVSVGAANTIYFEKASKVTTACDTSPAATTGTFNYAAVTGPSSLLPASINTFQSATNGDVCAVTSTTGSVQGVAEFVIQ